MAGWGSPWGSLLYYDVSTAEKREVELEAMVWMELTVTNSWSGSQPRVPFISRPLLPRAPETSVGAATGGVARMSVARKLPKRYLLFFSYAQKDTVAETSRLCDAATQQFPKAKIFRDMDVSFKLSELVHHVQQAHNVVVLLSENYPKRHFTLVELHFALKSGANVCAVRVTRPGMESFDFDVVSADIESGKVKDYLDKKGWGILREHGITEEDVCRDLKTVMDIVAVPFSCANTTGVLAAQIADIFHGIEVPSDE